MAMAHYLAGLPSRVSETKAVDHIIKPHLQNLKQVFASDPGPLLRLSEMLAKLPFQQSIGVPRLLLLPELETAVRYFSALGSLSAGGQTAPL